MGKKLGIALAGAAFMFGPVFALFGVLLLVNPAAADCLPGGAVSIGNVPSTLTATTANGDRITLDKEQLTHAVTIVTIAGETPGVGAQGATIALMAALTESRLRMLANTSAYPDSTTFPNDGDGADHDSLGLFQMRPRSGWGTVTQLMDASYQARAFFGGETGPNHGSPAGLLDIPGWQQRTDGEAAQAVEVSAYPDRYANFQPVAEAILAALARTTATTSAASQGSQAASERLVETSRVVFPLPAGTWTVTDRFGPRIDPITGQPGFHHGVDFGAAAGTPIRSATDGRVVTAGMVDGTGTITILATVDQHRVALTYLHMYANGIGVKVGELVTAGQQIGQVGSSGPSTGPHLHFEVQPGGTTANPIDPLAWLRSHDADSGAEPTTQTCTTS